MDDLEADSCDAVRVSVLVSVFMLFHSYILTNFLHSQNQHD